jgi:hypothetical protein
VDGDLLHVLDDQAVPLEQAKEVISRAEQFLKVAEQLIGSISTSNM